MSRSPQDSFLDNVREYARVRRLRICEAEAQHMQAWGDGPHAYTVCNYRRCTVYTVDLQEMTCTCPDAQFNKPQETSVFCKHLLYVALCL